VKACSNVPEEIGTVVVESAFTGEVKDNGQS
jgi:hypothetical protein